MASLRDLQRAMCAALLHGRELPGLATPGLAPPGLAPHGLAVYRNTVLGNLTAALRVSFPAVERLVGEAFFAAAAAEYIAASPPSQANLYDWGDSFAGFLAAWGPSATLAYLADVARLEWAVGRALHAPDIPPADPARLAAIPPDLLRFAAHPASCLLALAHPARPIWQAVLARDDAALEAIDLAAGGEHLLVHRGPAGAEFLDLGPSDAALTEKLLAGLTLAEALESACHAPDDAARLLGELLARGILLIPEPDFST